MTWLSTWNSGGIWHRADKVENSFADTACGERIPKPGIAFEKDAPPPGSACVNCIRAAAKADRSPIAQQLWPELMSARTAAMYCDTSQRAWHRDNSAGRVPQPIHLGGRVRWRRSELKRWIEAGCPGRDTWAELKGNVL